MAADADPRPSDPIVYLDISDIHKGGLAALKEGIRGLVDELEPREPQLISYGFHLDERAGEMTVVAVHPDSASLELHMELGSDGFRKLGEFLTLKEIRVYGPISERARDLLQRKLKMLGGESMVVSERFAGFDHLGG
jgi:hypothetical protein